jgi:HSP20 family protein
MAKKKESKEIKKVEPSGFLSPLEGMERRLEDFFRRPFSLMPSWWSEFRFPEAGEFSPSFDIFEEGENIVVKGDLSGMKKEDLDVNLTDDTVTISGEKKKEAKVEKKDYYRLERSHGSFSRSFHLPEKVQTDRAKAKFEGGVLEIRIPKTEEAKKRKKKLNIE